MARLTCRSATPAGDTQPAETAAALIAQGKALTAETQPACEPMNRYTYPFRSSCSSCSTESSTLVQSRILEAVLEQNQLLVDLTCVLNSLTAAVLNAQSQK